MDHLRKGAGLAIIRPKNPRGNFPFNSQASLILLGRLPPRRLVEANGETLPAAGILQPL
jgi:hypothetical protein